MPDVSPNEIGVARVAFAGRFQAFVDYQTPEEDVVSRERDLIQLFSLTFVRVLFLLGENKQVPMLMQYVQAAMGDTVTPKGLQRPTIMGKGQILLEICPETPDTLAVFRLTQDQEVRKALAELPMGDEGHFYPATVIFFLQYLIRVLSDSSLFFLMLVLGGVMEYFEKIGKTNDLKALTDAPVYGFSTAMRYIQDEQRRSTPFVEPPAGPSTN